MSYLSKKEDKMKINKANMIYRVITNKTFKDKDIAKASTQTKSPHKIKTLSDLPDDLLKRVVLNDYKSMLKYKLKSWVPLHKLNMYSLSENHNAIDFLSLPKNNKYIYYPLLSKNTNPKAVELLRQRIIEESLMSDGEYKATKNKIAWITVAKNPYLFDIFKENMDKIRWDYLSSNPMAINLLLANKSRIDFDGLSENPSTRAIKFLRLSENFENISWAHLSGNPNPYAIEFLSLPENFKNIVWEILSGNPNKKVIKLLNDKWESEKYLMETDID